MADSIVHIAAVYAAGRPVEPIRRYSLFLGTLAPDVVYKCMLYFFGAPTSICECSHVPAFTPLFAGLFALLFVENRARAFLWFSAGMSIHILVDMGKSYCGSGVIYLLWPFETRKFEIALYDIYDWRVPAVSVLLIIAIEVIVRTSKRSRN